MKTKKVIIQRISTLLTLDIKNLNILSEEEYDKWPIYDISNDIGHSDPSVKYFIVKNLDRFMITVGNQERQINLIDQITSDDFITEILPFSELIFEYVKQIVKLSTSSNWNKLVLLQTLERILNDSLEVYIIESIEGGLLTILSEMSEGILDNWVRILQEFYDSKIVAKQCLIPSIVLQFYPMLSQSAQNWFIEIYQNLFSIDSHLIKRKICQSLHECLFLSDEEILNKLENLIKDQNEYVRKEAVNEVYILFNSNRISYKNFIEILKDVFQDENELSWRVKYAAIEVLYKCIAKISVESLQDPDLISLLQVYFDIDSDNTSSLHNIIGIDWIFRWAKKIFSARIEEKFEKNNMEENKQDQILAEHFIRLADQIILYFSQSSTHVLVKEKICCGISKFLWIPVINKDLKYRSTLCLSTTQFIRKIRWRRNYCLNKSFRFALLSKITAIKVWFRTERSKRWLLYM